MHTIWVLDNLISKLNCLIIRYNCAIRIYLVTLSCILNYPPAQLRVKDEYLKTVINLDVALEYFIPTTTGPGACTFALVHYLVYVHNNFIDWCRGKNKARYVREREREREERKIEVTVSQLYNYNPCFVDTLLPKSMEKFVCSAHKSVMVSN